jgi:hypothetical protein
MKANMRKLFLGVFVVGIAIAFSSSCSKVKDLTTTCITSTGCGGKSFKTCADASGSGYYEYNSVKYSYTLSTVSAAATKLNTAMGCK